MPIFARATRIHVRTVVSAGLASTLAGGALIAAGLVSTASADDHFADFYEGKHPKTCTEAGLNGDLLVKVESENGEGKSENGVTGIISGDDNQYLNLVVEGDLIITGTMIKGGPAYRIYYGGPYENMHAPYLHNSGELIEFVDPTGKKKKKKPAISNWFVCGEEPGGGDENGADENGDVDGADENGDVDGADENGDVDGADENGDVDGADENGDVDGADENGDVDGADENGDVDGADENGDVDGADENGDVDGADENGDVDGADENGDVDGADENGADEGNVDGTEMGGDNGDVDGTEIGGDNGDVNGDDDGTEEGDEGGEELPDTGSATALWLVGGAALLALGGALLVFGRRTFRATV
ncbi:LPXTG cell wall anchor domain-containing protein [Phytoactinopolyspora alkaliphila]|uniref:LPXTG cell wall anchor domain-containing protein n=1 Tax=Phytoactinopolyspora alkaliphila TaxID=1783498 RepID=A0A6N9YM97_9ACTN|nr:LPXTG cell wall anchor domain-containing protein [Phytoactinopolyspora alkaliphila]NED96092.1 LPXTG cell wall anchor domain-containing protein [Phytoactinopolyspora alkaliphila]